MITLWSSDVGATLANGARIGHCAWIMFGRSSDLPLRFRPWLSVEAPGRNLVRIAVSWLGASVLVMLTVRVVALEQD